jgi:hypothetical protein
VVACHKTETNQQVLKHLYDPLDSDIVVRVPTALELREQHFLTLLRTLRFS